MPALKRRWGYNITENRRKRRNIVYDFDKIKEDLVNKGGSVRSIEENSLILQALAYFQKQSHSLDQACKLCVEKTEIYLTKMLYFTIYYNNKSC
jgi:hypothetical protein